VQALDAARLVGALELRAEDTLVIADEDGPVAVPFAAAGERAAVSRSTRRIALVAVGVPAVADLVVEEALWTAWDILR
jgi:DNA/RNA-binding domain of Phe-tRNA-synthetase-like protein